jgi:MYXO-CTERM domain-containing protein
VKCQADLEGGCKVQCSDPKGAIFCDGQYVDSGGNLEKCADALNAILNLKFEASASAECSGNECSAEAKASASACSTSPQDGPHTPPVAPGVIVLGAIGAAIARRVRRGGS